MVFHLRNITGMASRWFLASDDEDLHGPAAPSTNARKRTSYSLSRSVRPQDLRFLWRI